MRFQRSSGVLLHVSSLPGPFGIGDLGPTAHSWVDWLADSGSRYWQVLPLGPTGYGNSPYMSHSSVAGNPDLISPELLADWGLVDPDLLTRFAPSDQVGFAQARSAKERLLQVAYDSLRGALATEFAEFRELEAGWLEPYALFMAIKQAHGGGTWVDWPRQLRVRGEAALREAQSSLANETALHAFAQFVFYKQLADLRAHATARGVEIIGDIPIYVAPESVEVWLNPELFSVDIETGRPTSVGGIPPDRFSPDGQIWGNPTYRWAAHARDDYRWWAERLHGALRQVDVIRIDHFTGFVKYYEMDGSDPDVGVGTWSEGPGYDLFHSVEGRLGPLPMLVEDLGPLGEEVEKLRVQVDAPGMRVLQEAFDGDPANPALPELMPVDCVVYTGTHDYDTARGRIDHEDDDYRARALAYTSSDVDDYAWGLISVAWQSRAVISIAPVQDLLGLGSEARMNWPGRPTGNWRWRMTGQLSTSLTSWLRDLNLRTGRDR